MTVIVLPEGMTLHGEVRYRRTYTCHLCGSRGLGDTRTIDISMVENAPLSPHAMPVGWGSYLEGFRCPECLS